METIISENIKRLRELRGLTQEQLAEAAGVNRVTIAKYESGRTEPSSSAIIKLATALNVSPNKLLQEIAESDDETKQPRGVRIPVLGRVQAGVPIDAIEEILDWEEIDRVTAMKGEHFGLVVRGDSMETDIRDGDVVIVRKQSYAETGDIVIALVNGDDATVKKIKYQKNGIMLIPLNSAYEPLFYSAEEIESLPVSILGVVVESRRKFK